jgi:diguanylate cyclase (GGDEF)-like protein
MFNSRRFYERLEEEIARCLRTNRPFTLAYIDLDNFKTINDLHGHSVGDQVLAKVAEILKRNLRRTDVVARLGGDEFVVLLVETDSESAKVAYSNTHEQLLETMQSNSWPVTFSTGVVTFETAPQTTNQAIRIADELMYGVKKTDKRNVLYKIWNGA